MIRQLATKANLFLAIVWGTTPFRVSDKTCAIILNKCGMADQSIIITNPLCINLLISQANISLIKVGINNGFLKKVLEHPFDTSLTMFQCFLKNSVV